VTKHHRFIALITALLDVRRVAVASAFTGLVELDRPRRPLRSACTGPCHGVHRTLAGTVALTADVLGQAELMSRRCRRVPPSRSSLAGFRFPREVIVLAVRSMPLS
jgi:hypothetical protein